MTIVDVDTIAAKHESKLIDQALPASFDSKHVEHFNIVIRDGPRRIDLAKAHYFGQGCTVSLDDPVIIREDKFTRLRVVRVILTLRVVDL